MNTQAVNKVRFKWMSYLALAGLSAFSTHPAAMAGNRIKSTQSLKRLRAPAQIHGLQETAGVSDRNLHARELLGKQYPQSIVSQAQEITQLPRFVFKRTEARLKPQWKNSARAISQTILEQSQEYGFDPVFLMAVIENESGFNPETIGTHGEIGLMQILPNTAQWIAHKFNLPWTGPQSLKNPVTNIILGSAYLAYLREKFKFQSQLYLAAYNMGSKNVHRALARQVMPREYPTRVMRKYVGFYTELHSTHQQALLAVLN